jgi:hypothetical protein
MKNLYNFSKNNMTFHSTYNYNPLHPDGEEYKYKVFINNEKLTNDIIAWYKKSNNHFHLGYIGFIDKYQNKGILKNYIHPHCIDFMKHNKIEIITLKPLATAFMVWVLLGFEIENEIEELHIKQMIKEFLLENGIVSDDFGKMRLKEIVEKYKQNLKSKYFPPKLEKVYYTNFRKVLK